MFYHLTKSSQLDHCRADKRGKKCRYSCPILAPIFWVSTPGMEPKILFLTCFLGYYMGQLDMKNITCHELKRQRDIS
jgi:hypothetical protein